MMRADHTTGRASRSIRKNGPRSGFRLGTAPLFVLFVVTACGEPPIEVIEPPGGPPLLDDEAAMAAPLADLRAAGDAWAAEALRMEGTGEGVHAAREGARLFRLHALRDPGAGSLDRARSLLETASLRRDVEGACDAALELGALLGRDAADAEASYLVAYRTARRFTGEADADCAAEARRVTIVLEPFRPDAARLYAIDADPDRGDPSVGLGEASAVLDPIERWTMERHTAGSRVTITSVATFGEAGAEAARVVVALDGVSHFAHEDVAASGELPRRLVLTLEGAELAEGIAPATPVGAGGLVRVRSSGDDEAARIVLDLEANAEVRIYALPEPFRVVVDLSAPSAVARPRAVDLIVLDPGHGGDDYGARAYGLHEADLALDLALRVRDVLSRRAPGIRVVLTRESDTFVSLEQRAAMANAIDADAFVSIHLNAADEDVAVDHGGITTFVLDTTDDRAALRLAARENGTGTAAVTELQRILAGLHRDDQVAGSRALADRVHRSLLASGRTVLPRLHDRHVRSAMFYVLVGAVMPAILVEASFMTREDEARALRTEAYRDAIARGIADGIVRYAED